MMTFEFDLDKDADGLFASDYESTHDDDDSAPVERFEDENASHPPLISSEPTRAQREGGEGQDDRGGRKDRVGVVLFLGKTVAGKTTLCKLLAGGEDEAGLSVEERMGQFLIVDRNGQIGQGGTSTTKEPVCLPMAIADHEDDEGEGDADDPDRVMLCDCAGYGDTRGADAEINQLLLLRRTVLAASALKVALVVEHASVVAGTCLDGVVALLGYAVQLLADLDRYRAAVCLIVTKVPNSYRKVSGQLTLKGDDEVLAEVLEFLKGVKGALRQDDGNLACLAEAGTESANLRARWADLASALVMEGADRVALLRCPDETGPAVNCEVLQQGKRGVQRVLLRRGGAVRWVASRHGLGYPLSLSARNGVLQQVQALSKEIPELVDVMVHDMKLRYCSLLEPLDVGDAIVLLRCHAHCPTDTAAELCRTCFKDPVIEQHIGGIFERFIKLRALQEVHAEDVLSAVLSLEEEKKLALRCYLDNWGMFFEFLQQLADYVWSYEVQAHQQDFDVDVDNIAVWGQTFDVDNSSPRHSACDGERETGKGIDVTTDNIRTFLEVLRRSGAMQDLNLAELEFEEPMLTRINALLHEALRHEPCVERFCNAVEVRGQCVVLSTVLPRIKELASSLQPKSLTLFACDTVYLDTDLHAEGWRLKLAVVAPRWHVVNHPEFHLNGQPSQEDFRPPALSRYTTYYNERTWCATPGSDGSAGAPGLPGGSGGSFLGAYAECENGTALTVSVCGGRGGAGQPGNDGQGGCDGNPAMPAFYSPSTEYDLGVPSFVFALFYSQRSRVFVGYPGQKGGRGGDGGCGGDGGLPGEVTFIPNNGCFQGKILKHKGECGTAGNGGAGGEGGMHGRNSQGTQHFLLFIPVGVSTSPVDTPRHAESGEKGKAGGNTKGFKQAEKAEIFSVDDQKGVLKYYLHNVQKFSNSHLPSSRQQLREMFCKNLSKLLKGCDCKWSSKGSELVCLDDLAKSSRTETSEDPAQSAQSVPRPP